MICHFYALPIDLFWPWLDLHIEEEVFISIKLPPTCNCYIWDYSSKTLIIKKLGRIEIEKWILVNFNIMANHDVYLKGVVMKLKGRWTFKIELFCYVFWVCDHGRNVYSRKVFILYRKKYPCVMGCSYTRGWYLDVKPTFSGLYISRTKAWLYFL